VATGSGSLSSQYAVTSQYRDGGGRAGNSSAFGGGCIDYGDTGGSACDFVSSTLAGHNYGDFGAGCPPTGGSYGFGNNGDCVTDSQIQGEVAAMVNQTGIVGRTSAGYTPVIVVLMPAGVETCLDAAGNICSANSDATKVQAQFCSYHSHVNVGGTDVAYAVQPWTPYTACDEPKLTPLPQNPTPQQVAQDAGIRIVNPVSQGHIGAIVNPGLNGWVALDGSEITDNGNGGYGNGGCPMAGPDGDTVQVGSNRYVLRREFNNGGVIASDPDTYFGCAPNVILAPAFVVPSGVNPGDVVELDGSATASTLVVPNAGYQWDFGDGTTAVGPSVEHIYGKPGNYTVKLTVTDRGGNVASVDQTLTVVGPSGQPQTTTTTTPASGLHFQLQLIPQGLRSVFRSGITVRVSSNEPADGIAWVTITRAAAKRAHIKAGRGAYVVIGRGTVTGIKNGSVNLHLRLPSAIRAKLLRLRHVALTIHLTLITANRGRSTQDVVGHY
jgi:hypothetical protein